jgi:hypothetical protein
MSGSKTWRPQACSCGSGQSAMPHYDERGNLLVFACVSCRGIKLAVFKPEMLTDPYFFSVEHPTKEKD